MTWLTWRQHRLQLLAGGAVLALLTAFLVPSGLTIASAFRSSGLSGCLATAGQDCESARRLFQDRYSQLQFLIPLFLVLPVLLGVFWGAPLVAREIEQGTHRLAWTQSVGRARWATTKMAALTAATAAGFGLFAWLLSWWSRPFVTSDDDRFGFGIFDLRGIVPVGYALFALAAGVAAGALIRRTVPAMLATFAVYAAVRVVVEIWLRPHFARPATIVHPFFGTNPREGLGDWVVSTTTIDRAGHVLAQGERLDPFMLASNCPGLVPSGGLFPPKGAAVECAQRIGLQVRVTYQPGNRYWLFQGIEIGIFVVLAVALLGFSIWWIRRLAA
jgi:hypothetical protein